MDSASPSPPPGENRLLASLPRAEHERLAPYLDPVLLAVRQPLYEPNQPIAFVYFPRTAVVSLMTLVEGGPAVEVATVGNEGMVGLSVFLGVDRTPGRAWDQIPGEAVRIRAGTFRELVRAGGPLPNLLGRYAQGLFTQLAQSAACNRLHPITQRCARWLLMTHDRVGADQFPLTQEFLAQMLGVRRATATVVAGSLQAAGLIAYRRGRITVTDRTGLEATACACYRSVREEFDRLLGGSRPAADAP